MSNRIDRAFADLSTKGRKGLLPFVTAGLPDLDPVTVTREVPCNVFHEDVPGGHLSQQALLQNAPQQEAGCILVPRVLE